MKNVKYYGDVNRASDRARQYVIGAGAQASFGRSRQVGPGGYGAFGGSPMFSPSYGPMGYGGFGGPPPFMPPYGGGPPPTPYPVYPTMPQFAPFPVFSSSGYPSIEPPGFEWDEIYQPFADQAFGGDYGPPSLMSDEVMYANAQMGLSDFDELGDLDEGLGLYDGTALADSAAGGNWFTNALSSIGSGISTVGSGIGSGLSSVLGGAGSGIDSITTPLSNTLTQVAPALTGLFQQSMANKHDLAKAKLQAKIDKEALKFEIDKAKVLTRVPGAAAVVPTTPGVRESGSGFSSLTSNNTFMLIAAVAGGALLMSLLSRK